MSISTFNGLCGVIIVVILSSAWCLLPPDDGNGRGVRCPRSAAPGPRSPWSWREPRPTTPTPVAGPGPGPWSGRVMQRSTDGRNRPLVEHLLGNLISATAAPDTAWAATVERQRCFLQQGAPPPVAALVARLAFNELNNCDPALLWDASMPAGEDTLRQILSALSRPYVLARTPIHTAPSWMRQPVNPPYARRRRGHWRDVLPPREKCRHVLALVDDVMSVGALLGNFSEPRVVVVSRSPKWRIRDYLGSPVARNIRNLLVVQDRSWRHGSTELGYPDMDLYTHRLFVDSLGYSEGEVLTAWRCDRLTRPQTNLFPLKMLEGFAGHQFTVSASDTPPYMYRTQLNSDGDLRWDGVEIRLLQLLSERLNFTLNVREAIADDSESGGSAVRVVNTVVEGAAELGTGGIYVTQPRIGVVDVSFYHTQDCAVFLTLASVALPRYRAIMGPFQWTVWLALTLTYMFAIIPLVFSHSFSLRVLIKNPGQIENMFWYVFGTFTNAFSFKGRDSWTGTSRSSTRMIIGWYWVFSIIVTACYTGCIISFIAFPAFPSVIDHIWQLLSNRYRIGTLRTDGWPTWFLNSSDPLTDKLLRDMDTVPSFWEGMMNMTRAYFWRPYSFLGSRLYLEHVVRTNYTAQSKKSMVHISRECLVPFWVALIFPKAATYSERFNQLLMRSMQTGITEKLRRDVAWDVMRSNSKSTLLQVSSGGSLRLPPPEERMLTLDDTQGMFLLLGAGFAIAALALTIENMTGRVACCRRHCQPGPRRRSSVASVPPELAEAYLDEALGQQSRRESGVSGVSGVTATTAPSRAGSGSTRSDTHSDHGVDGVRQRRPSNSGAASLSSEQQQFLTTVDVHAEQVAPPPVTSVFSRVMSVVTASVAFRKTSRRASVTDEAIDSEQRLRIPEDHVLHLSNAWSDASGASGATSDGDDAHIRLAGRCRRGSVYPTQNLEVQPVTPDPPTDDDGEDDNDDAGDVQGGTSEPPRWGSSLFGSPVHLSDYLNTGVDVGEDVAVNIDADVGVDDVGVDDVGAGDVLVADMYPVPDVDDDSCTYILLHGSSEDVNEQPARPPTPYAQRPVPGKLGHRRRASVAVSDAGDFGALAPQEDPSTSPPGSFPDTPPPSPRRDTT